HGCQRLVGFDLTAHLDAAHIRQVDVEQHDVDRMTVHQFERATSGRGFDDVETRAPRDLRFDETARVVVVDDEHQRLWAGGGHDAFSMMVEDVTAPAIADLSASRVSADFDRTVVAGDSRLRSSSDNRRDVTITTGTRAVTGSARSLSNTSNPVMSVRRRSSRITSGRSSRARRSPCRPEAASMTS